MLPLKEDTPNHEHRPLVSFYDFRLLFNLWAGICTKALEEVKSASPIPTDLQPNQRL